MFGRGKGKAKAIAGSVTGDREVEAEGRVEEQAADPASPVPRVTGEAVAAERRRVRAEHGDIHDDQQPRRNWRRRRP